jgi:hypothetical protein
LGNFNLFYEQTGSFADVVAKDGTYTVGFGGNARTGAVLSQTFDTLAGETYAVSFFVAAQQLGSGIQDQSFKAEAFDASSTLLGITGAIIPASTTWVEHSFSFVAAGGSSTLSFTDTSSGAAGNNWTLDDVSVIESTPNPPPTPSPIPEPSTYALMALGLGLVGMTTRRRKSA